MHETKCVSEILAQLSGCNLLLLRGLLSSLGDLATLARRLLNRLHHTDSDGLTHVTHSETTKRRVLVERLNAHGLGGDHLNHGGVTRLDVLGVLFEHLTRTTVDLLQDIVETAGNVGRVAVKHGRVTVADLTRVVHHNDLSVERGRLLSGVVLRVRSHVTTANVLNRHVLHVETNVVTGQTLSERLVVHLNRLNFSSDVRGSERNDHTRLDHTSLDTTHRDSTDTTDLVHILERETERLVGRARRGLNGVNSVNERLTGDLAGLGLLLPALVPRHVGGGLNHVVTVPTRDRHEGNRLGVVTNLLNKVRHLTNNFVEALLRVASAVHLVHSDNQLTHTESERKQGVLTRLTVLRDTSLELTGTTSDDEDGAVSLRGTRNHVLNEVTVTRGVDDRDVVLGGLEAPQGNVDGDTTLTLGLELVKHPSVLERTLTELSGLLLELLDRTLVDTTALVDKVTSGRRLTRVDVTNDDQVNVLLLLSHC